MAEAQSQTSRDRVLIEVRNKLLNKAGLVEPPKPDNSDSLFTRWNELKNRYGGIADIPSNLLGDLLDGWSEMLAYTRWLEAVADVKFQTAKELLGIKKKQLFLLKDGNREVRAAEVESDQEYIELFNIYIEENTAFTLIKGVREGYEQRYFSLSREISRRTQSIEGNNRIQNIRDV